MFLTSGHVKYFYTMCQINRHIKTHKKTLMRTLSIDYNLGTF